MILLLLQSVYAPSIEVMPTGALKLYKSFQEYEFNQEGMTHHLTPLGQGASNMQQSYKVQECAFGRQLGVPRYTSSPWLMPSSPVLHADI